MLSIVLQNQIQQSRYIKIRGICFRYINPRRYTGGGGEEVDATPHLGFF